MFLQRFQKPTSDAVTQTLPTQDGAKLNSGKRQRSPDLVAVESNPHGMTRSCGQDNRSKPVGTIPEDVRGKRENAEQAGSRGSSQLRHDRGSPALNSEH